MVKNVTKEKIQVGISEFQEALKETEKIALKVVREAPEPNARALEIIEEIKKVIEKIESEANIGEVVSTEAHVVGVGVGVL